jgi:hypothetical protein
VSDNLPKLRFEAYRGGERIASGEFDSQSVTIGRGGPAMFAVDDEALAELQSVVNVEEDGTVNLLDLVGGDGGTLLNGKPVGSNAAIKNGDEISFGAVKIIVHVQGGAAADDDATDPNRARLAPPTPAPQDDLPERDEDTDVGRPAVAEAAAQAEPAVAASEDDDEAEEGAAEDVMAFIMRSGTSQSDLGLDKKRPKVLEVNQIWGEHVLDARHFARGTPVTVGASLGWRWSLLGVNMAWVSRPLDTILPWFPPLWSEVRGEWRSDFYTPDTNLPGGRDHTLFTWQGGSPVANVSSKWEGFVDVGEQRYSLGEAVTAGKASRSGDMITVPLDDGVRIVVDIDGVVFFAHQVHAGATIVTSMTDDIDYPFLGSLAFMSFLGMLFAILIFTVPPGYSNEMVEIPDRFVELLVEKPPEPEKDKGKKPDANPDAGEGAKAKREEGKVGKKDAKMEKAKGNKVEMKQQELDRQIAEDAGVLGALRDGGALDGVFGTSGLNADIAGGIGGLIGAKGTQIGSGGLGARGSGLGGGGTAEGLGGLGTKGIGSGASGFGSGGGNFGAKGDGAISAVGGDPIILGALDKALIDEVVKRHMNQIKYCYQRELTKNPSLAGKIVIKFTIAKDGTVSASSVKASTMSNPAVEQCVAGRFLKMQFPTPKGGGIVLVSYPFVFGT